ncbi:YceD family protein [Viridibacillus sp. NPDC096237]|uniref:YceD family protein n=1 Tax=Viridibacillus sp. NPDC096237 TaxID=3390721 RepID=UPI003CFF2A52
MKWAIPQLSKYRQNGMPIDELVQLDDVMKRNPDIRQITPVHVKGHCTFGASQITCHFQLTGTLILPCARTWEDVEFSFDIESDEIFSWSETVDENDYDNLHVVEGEVVNVDPVLEELILLEIPMQVYKEDATIPAPKNNSDWSFSTEDELAYRKQNDTKKIDPRLANLAKYFDQTDE